MDDEKGEMHPYFGARIMMFLFGLKWYCFTLYHSRFLAKKNKQQFSKLCVADKYCIVIQPWWLYKIQANLSGEIKEYMKDASKNSSGTITKVNSQKEWHYDVKDYVSKWVEEHKDLKQDNWTTIKN